jgi:hypothetical protein
VTINKMTRLCIDGPVASHRNLTAPPNDRQHCSMTDNVSPSSRFEKCMDPPLASCSFTMDLQPALIPLVVIVNAKNTINT